MVPFIVACQIGATREGQVCWVIYGGGLGVNVADDSSKSYRALFDLDLRTLYFHSKYEKWPLTFTIIFFRSKLSSSFFLSIYFYSTRIVIANSGFFDHWSLYVAEQMSSLTATFIVFRTTRGALF